ncbi:unnamed protein product, partial [Oppiella nova]
YKEGDEALNWYAVIFGSLDVQVSNTDKVNDVETVCTLGVGTAFGESVLGSGSHSHSIVTQEPCTLLRVKRLDFQDLWSQKSHLMQEIVANCYDSKAVVAAGGGKLREQQSGSLSGSRKGSLEEESNHINDSVDNYHNMSLINTEIPENEPMSPLFRVGWTIRSVIMHSTPQLIRDRKYHLPLPTLYHKCIIGSELIDWILNVTTNTPVRVHSRGQAAAMCQVLLEGQVLIQVTTESQSTTPGADEIQPQFQDRYLLYRFCFDQQIDAVVTTEDKRIAESELMQSLSSLAQLAPDAILRLILRKPPQKRTDEEIESVFEELLHIKALSHLSNSVKKELAAVIAFESHLKKGTIR